MLPRAQEAPELVVVRVRRQGLPRGQRGQDRVLELAQQARLGVEGQAPLALEGLLLLLGAQVGDAAVALCCGGGEKELVGWDAGLVLAEVGVRACFFFFFFFFPSSVEVRERERSEKKGAIDRRRWGERRGTLFFFLSFSCLLFAGSLLFVQIHVRQNQTLSQSGKGPAWLRREMDKELCGTEAKA